jgi:hypothetical protein
MFWSEVKLCSGLRSNYVLVGEATVGEPTSFACYYLVCVLNSASSMLVPSLDIALFFGSWVSSTGELPSFDFHGGISPWRRLLSLSSCPFWYYIGFFHSIVQSRSLDDDQYH